MAEEKTDVEGVPDVALAAANCYRQAERRSSKWRQDAKNWFDMEAGEQWDTDDLRALEDEERPAVVFNRILRAVNAIIGTQISNRQETQFFPREIGDVHTNELLTAGGDWARDNCDAEDEESDAFRDMTVTGMGWTETRMDYLMNAEGDIVIERVDPIEMYWDPAAKKRNLVDAKWMMHIVSMPLDEFRNRWPTADLDSASAPWEEADPDAIDGRHHVYPQDAYKQNQALGANKAGAKMMKVAHYQWCEYQTFWRVGPKAERMSDGAFQRMKKQLDKAGVRYIKQRGVTWKRAFVAGATVLGEAESSPFPEGPTLRCMTYMRDRNRGTWFGIVKAMVDPQKFGNKFFSQILDIFGAGSKGGIMMETDAVEDVREVEEQWSRSDSVIQLKPGALSQNKIKEKPIVQLPPGMDQFMSFSLDAVHEVTGINLEQLGLANRAQPGILEHQRKQAGLTIIAPLFDALRRYRKDQGRVLLHFLTTYITDGRLIRIAGEDGNEQYVPLLKDKDTIEYDVVIDESPTSPNMKEKVYGALVQILPIIRDMGIPLPPELLDYAPIPSKLATKWREMIEKSQGGDLPEEVKQQIALMQQELEKRGAQIKDLRDKRELAIAEQERKREAMLADQEIDKEQLEHKRENMADEFRLKREEADQDATLARERVETELMLKAVQVVMANTDGGMPEGFDLNTIRRVFRDDEPRHRRMHINRDEEGFATSIDVEDILENLEIQGNA